MRRPPSRTCFALALVVGSSSPLAAQSWNDSAALALITRAQQVRARQLADTALRDYRAVARGTLTFLGQLGDFIPPRVVQATQIATEVYWHAPNQTKQIVVGQRDTTILPTDNQFYRDRFGIVQNEFPDSIRLGEGRDVADVPHPLAPGGPGVYDYAIADSSALRIGPRTVWIIEVRTRPKDATKPRLVGTLFIDRDTGRLVRLAFTFTRPAYLDPRNENVAIVLENALVEGRFWLPRRQEVEVRRAGTFLDFPARGIIRGRWDVGDYAVNTEIPPQTFAGPPLEFRPPAVLRQYTFREPRVLDALPPDVTFASDEDVRRVRALAQGLVQRRALEAARRGAFAARSVSDFVRVDRAEGLALGAGGVVRPAPGASLALLGRYGLDDHQAKGRATLGATTASGAGVRLEAFRDFREAGDAQEVSRARNSIAAQEFGSDWTDPYDARGFAAAVDLPLGVSGFRAGATAGYEWQRALDVRARPAAGRYEPTLPADRLREARLGLTLDRAAADGPFGTTVRGGLRALAARTSLGCAGGPCTTFGRLGADLGVERAFGSTALGERRLVLETVAAGAVGRVPAQELAYFGGPVTGPGYDFHALAGRAGASQRVEWRFPVPFPSLSLGSYGRSPAALTLAPYAHAVYVARAGAAPPEPFRQPGSGWYPALGAGAIGFFDLVRLDVARGVGRGGRWLFSVDVTRDFWRIL
ncbi:hypothetical protein tb265_03750 [Gemmatimonadetes bacterium T265]|nr:hypothetical protein tb265_03750 [Gemmatimonadetes bacterium T265]